MERLPTPDGVPLLPETAAAADGERQSRQSPDDELRQRFETAMAMRDAVVLGGNGAPVVDMPVAAPHKTGIDHAPAERSMHARRDARASQRPNPRRSTRGVTTPVEEFLSTAALAAIPVNDSRENAPSRVESSPEAGFERRAIRLEAQVELPRNYTMRPAETVRVPAERRIEARREGRLPSARTMEAGPAKEHIRSTGAFRSVPRRIDLVSVMPRDESRIVEPALALAARPDGVREVEHIRIHGEKREQYPVGPRVAIATRWQSLAAKAETHNLADERHRVQRDVAKFAPPEDAPHAATPVARNLPTDPIEPAIEPRIGRHEMDPPSRAPQATSKPHERDATDHARAHRRPANRIEPNAEATTATPVAITFTAQEVPPAPRVEAHDAARRYLVETVERLSVHVADGAPQVRLELKQDVLPGTSVIVRQTGNQIEIVFECSIGESRGRVDRVAPAFTKTLARRLGREVVVLVRSVHDDDAPSLEFGAHPDKDSQ